MIAANVAAAKALESKASPVVYRVHEPPTREKLIAGLETMKQFDLGGLDVTYGPGLRTGTTYIDITIIGKAGKFVR